MYWGTATVQQQCDEMVYLQRDTTVAFSLLPPRNKSASHIIIAYHSLAHALPACCVISSYKSHMEDAAACTYLLSHSPLPCTL